MLLICDAYEKICRHLTFLSLVVRLEKVDAQAALYSPNDARLGQVEKELGRKNKKETQIIFKIFR